VFTTPTGTPLEERRVVRIFKDAVSAAGLPQSIRLYDCRHTAASLLYAQGAPELQISATSDTLIPRLLDAPIHTCFQRCVARRPTALKAPSAKPCNQT
jgi:integrase